MSDDFENVKARVVQYIKAGRLTKENAQQALGIYKALLNKGQKVSIDLVLQKKNFLIAPKAEAVQKQPAGKKPAIKKKAPKPSKKLLTVSEDDNKYVKRRRAMSRKPAIVGGVLLLVALLVAFILFQNADKKIKDYQETKKQEKQEKEKAKAKKSSQTSEQKQSD